MKKLIFGIIVILIITMTSCTYRGFTYGNVCDKFYMDEYVEVNENGAKEYHPKSWYITISRSANDVPRTFRVSEADYNKYDIGDYFDYNKEG